MKNYWYIARENELLLDCDRGFDPVKFGHVVRIWNREMLKIFWIVSWKAYPSASQDHFHVQVILAGFENIAWVKTALSLALGSDKHREIIAMGQKMNDKKNPWLVVSPIRWNDDRPPDHICEHENWRVCECLAKIQPR